MWSLNLVTPPAAAALDLTTEVIPHLRLSSDEAQGQAGPLASAISAATVACEEFTFRQLISATWELWLDSWNACDLYRDGALRLPKPQLQQQAGSPVDHGVLSIKYLDTAGVEQTLAADQYLIQAPLGSQGPRGQISRAYGVIWPSGRYQPGAIKVRYTAGYGDTFAAVPQALRQGMLLMVGELYERREMATTGVGQSINQITAERLWWPFRAW